MINIPTLSFCITCKNRVHQIQKTLKKNLDDNRIHQRFIEFVLIDFGSTDGLKEWILSEFTNDLSSGFLRYYYTEELQFWHASIAKNTAHICARHDILVNLDCDNFTGHYGGLFIINKFAMYNLGIVFHQFRGTTGDGSYGRISVLRKFFYRIGGYDESLQPMGYQDDDLLNRLKQLGLTYILDADTEYNEAIFNTKEEGISYTESTKDYTAMLYENRQKSILNLSTGKLIANRGIFGIRKNIFDNHGNYYEPTL